VVSPSPAGIIVETIVAFAAPWPRLSVPLAALLLGFLVALGVLRRRF
jgi:hypothetical protein